MVAKAALRALIVTELGANQSQAGWTGHGIVISRNQFSLTAKQREDVQGIGDAHGCHTCLTRLNVDRDQPWIADHIPPTELSAFAVKAYMPKTWDGQTRLYPQCHQCSHKQSAIVKSLKGKKAVTTPFNRRLISNRSADPAKCIFSTGPKVMANEGMAIQAIGRKHGCHSCGTSDVAP
jgi:hypothetical protein